VGITPRAEYSVKAALTCSLDINGRCGQPAAELLLVTDVTEVWQAFPRCASHPARDHLSMLTRWHPRASWIIVPLVKSQLEGELARVVDRR
jgi:hypothetical protein